MKRVIITAVLLVGSSAAVAQEVSDTDVLLGAAAGAAIGSTVGQGDGKKIATVLGGLIGANMARNRNEHGGYRYVSNSFDSYCRQRVPSQYYGNQGATRSWIDGCVNRLQQRQAELEQQAYLDGLNETR